MLAGKGMGARQDPLISWFKEDFLHKWGSLKSAYSIVIGKVSAKHLSPSWLKCFRLSLNVFWHADVVCLNLMSHQCDSRPRIS